MSSFFTTDERGYSFYCIILSYCEKSIAKENESILSSDMFSMETEDERRYFDYYHNNYFKNNKYE